MVKICNYWGVNENAKISGGFTNRSEAFKNNESKPFSKWTMNVYIEKVVYKEPLTIVFWSDGTKTSAKCSELDQYNPETGLMVCLYKKFFGSKAVKNLMNEWLPRENSDVEIVNLKKVRARRKEEGIK